MNSKVFAALEIGDFKSYLLTYFLPIFALDFLFLFFFLLGFNDNLVRWIGVIVFFVILIALFAYPMLLIDAQTTNIEETLHYFITYAGALSTVNLSRKELFKDLAEKERYPEIANIFKKVLYLVESIKVDFATAAYKISSILKTEHFSRFLERMGIALSFNSNVSQFFLDEQVVLMNAYKNVYQEGLERIRLVQDMFVSLILAFAFILATVLLIPFLTGIDGSFFLMFGIVGIILLDMMMVIFVKYFLTEDKLYHDMGYDEGRKTTLVIFGISLIVVLILIPFIGFLDLPIMLKFAFISSPMLIVGIYSSHQEALVGKRDQLFPSFIRSLGDVHQSKGGTLTTTVETLMPHNFGILNEMLERVYKRLKITSDKFNSWYYFSKESGSALIAEFMDIFVTVVYRGGSSKVAGKIVSDNMGIMIGLRDLKKEFSGTLKGNVYGTFFGLALTIYVSLLISTLLFKVFASLTEGLEGFALSMLDSIFPTGQSDTFGTSAFYIGIILFIHALISSYLIKEVDGGNKFSMFSDFVILLWIGAIMEILITMMFKGLFNGYFG